VSRIFSYWSGTPDWLEKLSVQSAIATGHEVTVFTYGEVETLSKALGCPVLPAASVFDDRDLDSLRLSHPSHFSDHFRLEGIAAGWGTWFDLDIVFLKPLPDDRYILGWQSHRRVGNSIMRFPANDPCLESYLAFCRQRPMPKYVMPWYPWTRKLTRVVKAGIAPLIGADRPCPKFGPDALTHFVSIHGLDSVVAPQPVYYPLPITRKILSQIDRPGAVEAFLEPRTICVHAWRGSYFGSRGRGRPASGWFAEQLAHYDKIFEGAPK